MVKKALFPIHIYQKNIKENVYLQDELVESIYNNYKNDKNRKAPEGWITNHIYTTFNDHEINVNTFSTNPRIREIYLDNIFEFFDQEVSFDILEFWVNVYENGEYQEEHTHLRTEYDSRPSQFSCIHFLKFDSENHIPVTFVDPIETTRYTSLEMNSNHYRSHYYPKIKEGDLLMFPSYLSHFVRPSQSTPGNPRITVSFNLAINHYGKQST
tara:strand:- start:404 stop:1039 length:636 start_codon:yes stop_codon:yes gene_type:complete